jgi:hypothetical protein
MPRLKTNIEMPLICILTFRRGGRKMKKWRVVPYLIFLLLGVAAVAWSQSEMPNGYWYKTNTTIGKLHEDYKECSGKNETQCMQAKGYKWVTEGVNPGYWFKSNTTVDKLHEDYRNCGGQEEVMCMEGKGYKWNTEGLERKY